MTRSIIRYIRNDFVTNVEGGPYWVIIKWGSMPTLLVHDAINDFYKYAKQ